MDEALAFVRGPLFASCFLVMILGLGRLVFLRTWEYRQVWRRVSQKRFPLGKALPGIGVWHSPLAKRYRASQAISVLSLFFHVGLILVPLFLASHVVLWTGVIGVGWWTIPSAWADILTIVTIVAAFGLFCMRTFHAAARFMSQTSDYLLLVLLAAPFISGFLASHPIWDPFGYNATMLIHVLSGDLVMALLPVTKLSHAVLFPFERVSSEVYWRMPAGAGDRVAIELHGRKEPAV